MSKVLTIYENVVSLQRCLMINKTTKTNQSKITTTKNKKRNERNN